MTHRSILIIKIFVQKSFIILLLSISADMYFAGTSFHPTNTLTIRGCAKRWLEKYTPLSWEFANFSNKTCPSCRSRVKKVTDDFRANNLLDVYLMMNPTKARSQAELQELDAE